MYVVIKNGKISGPYLSFSQAEQEALCLGPHAHIYLLQGPVKQ